MSSSTLNNENKSWQTLKEEGKRHFQNSNFEQALISYQEAIKQANGGISSSSGGRRTGISVVPQTEHEILLSNSVACRLKIGGPEMAFVAVEEAKKCVALNDKWAKAHIRLASAYIALGGHSNDACQSLQNAIRLDPSNQSAKQMLMKELRRDRMTSNHAGGDSSAGSRVDHDGVAVEDEGSPINVNEGHHTNHSTRPSAPPMNYSSRNSNHSNANANDNIDDSPSFMQRAQNYWIRLYLWYQHEALDSWKSLIQVMCFVLILYIAFGGRFGFESTFSNRASGRTGSNTYGQIGDYGKGNAYDQFYRSRDDYHRENTGYTTGSNTYDRGGSGTYDSRRDTYTNGRYRDSYMYNDDGYGRYDSRDGYHGSYNYGGGRRDSERYSRKSESVWDAFIPWILVAVILIKLNRLLGSLRRAFGVEDRGFRFGPRLRFGRGGMRFGFGPGVGVGMRYGGVPRGGFGGRAQYRRR